jgi:outer-membrane receptor for ferric coprogen and ferric-rhodotorulic acid
VSYGVEFDEKTSHTSPYAGLTYDFTDGIMGYVSYSDIYQPQDQADANDRPMGPSKGVNYEVGIKAEWLGQRLLTTLAVFKADQEDLATPTAERNEYGQNIYAPVDVSSKGVEFEATDRLNDNLDLVFGYTALEMDGLYGEDTYPWVPRQTANLVLTGRVPSYTALSFGLGGRWQSDIWNKESSGYTVHQDSYAVLNGYAAWNFLPNATLRANVDNITDEKYINTLRYAGYYGAPMNYTVNLEYRF